MPIIIVNINRFCQSGSPCFVVHIPSDYNTLEPLTDFWNKSTKSRTSTGDKSLSGGETAKSLTVQLTDEFILNDERTNPYRFLQKNWKYDKKTLFSPQNAYLLTDGRCGSTCSQFAKHITQKHYARVVGLGTWPKKSSDPIHEQRYDVSSFGSGSIYDSEQFQSIKRSSVYSSYIDSSKIPAAFPRKGTVLSFSHLESYCFTEQTKSNLLEYYIVEPDYWDQQYIHPDIDYDLNLKAS
ncbi:MAG: hypothetical protein EZS28_041785, partial [Streblomastix strix]